MSTTPRSLFSRSATGGGDAPRPKRHLVLKSFLGFLVLFALLVAGLSWYASTPQFANKVRTQLIGVLENATGGRVGLGAFRWSLFHLQVEADNLTIHGLEAPGQAPYVHLDRLVARIKIISLFRAQIGLDYLGIDNPEVHIIVYKDGSTNQPVPKTKSAPLDVNKTVNQIFDLQANRAEINHGTLLLNQKAIPFSLAANDLEVGINYLRPTDQYKADISIADLTARRDIAAPVHSKLSLEALMGRNTLGLTDLHLSAGDSTLAAHGSVTNYTNPRWQLAADGSVDLREAEALAGIPGLDRGVVSLHAEGKGTAALFDVLGNVKIAGATYVGSGISVRGLNASTDLHATQDDLAVENLRATLAGGGLLQGHAHIDHWLAPSTPADGQTPTKAVAEQKPVSKKSVTAKAARGANRAIAHVIQNPIAKAQVSTGEADLRLNGFTLPSILSVIAPAKYQHLGFATTAGGTVHLGWTGTASDLAADAKIALQGPTAPRNGDVPVNGLVDVIYSGSTNSLVVHRLNVQTPGAQLNATGGVGLAAGARASLQVQASVSDLSEFNRAFAVFGVAGKNGASPVPVALHGQATFNGVVTGSLAAPDVTGHLAVNDFDILLNQLSPATAAAVPQVTNPQGQKLPVPVAAAGTGQVAAPGGAPASTFHIDSLTADAEYAPSHVSVQSAVITRGAMQVHAAGQLHAHRTRHGWAFDKQAAIQATASVTQARIPELLALAGQSSLPVTGTLNLNVKAGGTLGNLNGGGHLSMTGGAAYGQPYKSLDADLLFAGQQVGASSLTLNIAGGEITGNGGYDLTSKQLHFQAQSSGLTLENFEALKNAPLGVRGQLAFSVQGSGTVDHPSAQAAVHLTNLVVSNPAAGGKSLNGAVDLNAHTANGSLLASINARLGGATLALNATTAISGDYATQASLTLANLDMNPFLTLFNVDGIQGSSVISGKINVNGPLKTPKLLSGNAQLSRIAVIAQGQTIATDGSLQASLQNGVLSLQPLHISGAGTDLHVQGRASLFGADRPIRVKANGTLNLKVGHSFDPDLNTNGMVNLNLTVGNTLAKPDVEGSVDFKDDNLAYGDLPNGINHLNGSLVFDQGRLTATNLTATSGGGDLTIGGYITYEQGVYGDLSVTGKQIRVRYPGGVSTVVDTKIRAQGTLQSILISGGVQITRFTIFPDVDLSAFSSNGVSPPPDPTAFANRIHLDVHVTSSPQLDINNSYAKLAGTVNLYARGTAENPSILGRISISQGEATFGGTHYVLQHGEIYFTNPVKIEPTLDLEASARVEDYSIIIGLHGTPDKLAPVFRSEPPLSEQDIFSLLALGQTQEESSISSQQQSQAGVNSTADTILGGALNATLSSRINKLFGGGSVKIDPNFVSGTGNSTARITVQQQIGKKTTVTYATNVNSTAQQLIQGQYNLTQNISVLALRDESGVFSFEVKLHRRYR
jgi:translocation and assembly module TamB